MVRLEIELLGVTSQDEIYGLRNYLKEQLPDAEFSIKEQQPLPSQMSGGIAESLIAGVLHATSSILLEAMYHNLIRPLLKKWTDNVKHDHPQLEIMSSLSNGEEKIHVLESSNGKMELFNIKYAIDTDKTYALLIGVSKFKGSFQPIPPIKSNVEDLCSLLADKKHIGIPRDHIFISQDESHVEIQKRMLQLARNPEAQTLIIYFAGHGHRSDVRKLSLIAADTEKIDNDIIGGIDFDFISQYVLKNAIARQKILILDTCHSGIAAQGSDDPVFNIDVKGSYILTSSSADDASYFEKDARNTYFTSALLNVLQKGVDNNSDMLTLEDLYGYTKEILVDKNMPYPQSKNELNIPLSHFFIARNPSFSVDKLRLKAYSLFREGKLQDALDEYRSLLKRFPTDENLRRQFEDCETELSFSLSVNEANRFFYELKDYGRASILYRKAYQIKKDAIVMEKIRQSEQLSASPVSTQPGLPKKLEKNDDHKASKQEIEKKVPQPQKPLQKMASETEAHAKHEEQPLLFKLFTKSGLTIRIGLFLIPAALTIILFVYYSKTFKSTATEEADLSGDSASSVVPAPVLTDSAAIVDSMTKILYKLADTSVKHSADLFQYQAFQTYKYSGGQSINFNYDQTLFSCVFDTPIRNGVKETSDKTMVINVAFGKVVKTFDGGKNASCISNTPKEMIATCTVDTGNATVIKVFDYKTGELLFKTRFTEGFNWTFDMKFSPDDRYLVASNDEFTRIFDMSRKTEIKKIALPFSMFNNFDFSKDSKLLAIPSEKLTILSMETLEIVKQFDIHANDIVFSPLNNNVIYYTTTDGNIRVLDISTGQIINTIGFREAGANLDALGVTPDGKYIAASGSGVGGKIKIFTVGGELLETINAHGGYVNRIIFNRNYSIMVSAADGTGINPVRIWKRKAKFSLD